MRAKRPQTHYARRAARSVSATSPARARTPSPRRPRAPLVDNHRRGRLSAREARTVREGQGRHARGGHGPLCEGNTPCPKGEAAARSGHGPPCGRNIPCGHGARPTRPRRADPFLLWRRRHARPRATGSANSMREKTPCLWGGRGPLGRGDNKKTRESQGRCVRGGRGPHLLGKQNSREVPGRGAPMHDAVQDVLGDFPTPHTTGPPARAPAGARARAPVCLLLAGTAHGRARTRTLARGYSCTVTNGEVAPWAWLLKGAPSSDRIGLPLHMQLARACQWAEARNAQHARARLAAGRALRGRARPRARARVMPTRARLLCLLGDRGGPAAVVDGIHCQSRGHRAPWYLSAGRNVRGSVLARRCAEQQLHGRRGGLKWTLRGSR